MALVRCPIHGLTYNNENPRGCPACAAERKGRASQAALMKDLVKATKKAEGIPETPRKQEGLSWFTKLRSGVPSYDQRKVLRGGIVIVAALVLVLFWTSRPKFLEQPFPPDVDDANLRTFPISTGQDISVVFAILGTRSPATHPTASSVQRYSYGTGLIVDALNGTVYSITLGVPNRTWRGLRVGADEQEIEGMLALLGQPRPGGDAGSAPIRSGRYQTYGNEEAVPMRTLTASVRPPNGCFDTLVELAPRRFGYLDDGGVRSVVVAVGDDAPRWVAYRVLIVDRARNGPLANRDC